MIRLVFEGHVKATTKGTPVPRHPGLVLFSWNAPCKTCGNAANLELNRVRTCRYDWRKTLK